MIGTAAVRSSARIASASSKPFMPGISMSVTIDVEAFALLDSASASAGPATAVTS